MPRETQTATAEPATKAETRKAAAKPVEAPTEAPDAPEEQPQQARRPRATQQSAREGIVREGQVPQVELYVPTPIKPDDLAELNVYQRWNAMIGEMGIIPKRGWNDHHKYWFTTDADLNAFIGPLLSKFHLLVIPSVLNHAVERFETAGKQYVTRVPMEIHVINADKPDDRFVVSWAGEGGDTVDKGLYKAFTGGLKYFFMKTLQVATGDDPEVFGRTDAIADEAAVSVATGKTGRPVNVNTAQGRPQPEKGGHQNETTTVQLGQLSALSRALGLGEGDERIRAIAAYMDNILKTDIYEKLGELEGEQLEREFKTIVLKTVNGADTGKVLFNMGEDAKKLATQKAQDQAAADASSAEEAASEAEQQRIVDEAAIVGDDAYGS